MDDTTRSIIERITVKYAAPTLLPSGHTSRLFFDCMELSQGDLARLAAQTTGHLAEGAFDLALGIAYSGVFFAAAVAGGRQMAILQTDGAVCGPHLRDKKVVLVNDVVVSGRRLLDAEKIVAKQGARVVGYACIVDRSEGKFGSAEKPLWSACQCAVA